MAKKKVAAGDKTVSQADRLELLEKWYQSIHQASNQVTKAEEKLAEAKASVKVHEKKVDQAANLLRQLTRDSPFQARLFDITGAEGQADEQKAAATPPEKKKRTGANGVPDDQGSGEGVKPKGVPVVPSAKSESEKAKKGTKPKLKIAKEDDEEKPAKKATPAERQKLPISDLGVTPTLTKRLEEAGIKTMGDLEAYVEHTPISMIKGIGAGKAIIIADAWMDWQNAGK